MNKSNLRIKNPCHLKWGELTEIENSKDRHCTECSWLIKDFRNMTNQEIINYLAERKGEKVCCAMHSDKNKTNSIQRIIKVWDKKIKSGLKENHFKKILLFFVGILMLTTGCEKEDDNTVIGEPVFPEEESEIVTKIKPKPLDSTLIKAPKNKVGL